MARRNSPVALKRYEDVYERGREAAIELEENL